MQIAGMQPRIGIPPVLGMLLSISMGMRASEMSRASMTILVFDYVGIDHETLRKTEDEADNIFRQAGVRVAWQLCLSAAKPSSAECPEVGPLTPALRLVSHLQLVPDQVRTDTVGYSTSDVMTVSWEQTKKLAQSGAGPETLILGLIVAHEFGHLLLGKSHSISGIMQAQWNYHDWGLAHKRWLLFLPQQATVMRKQLRTRGETLAAANSTH